VREDRRTMADGRFAPSPSGPLHLGSLRTALLVWLFARSAGSRFLLRVDDLDPGSSRREHAEGHQRDLVAFGLDWDGEPVHQADQLHRYHGAIDELVAAGLTYPCFCTRREVHEAAVAPHEHLPDGAYPGTCRDLTAAQRADREAEGRPAALRLRADGVEVTFVDRLHGPTRGWVDDFVLRRNDGTPAYNLAVVVDDHDQGIEEVVRGDDLLAGTPRQIHLAGLLGLRVPTYAHVPLVLGADGQRLAKRHGAVTLDVCADAGLSPDEVRSLLAHSLGLAGRGEVVSTAELVVRFDPDRLPHEPWTLPPEGLLAYEGR
jgi:glutamyl-tRNA synthetase